MKYLTILFSISLLISTPYFAQTDQESFKSEGSLIFSPFAGGYFFQDDQTFMGTGSNYELNNSYSLGIRIGYELSRYFDFEGTLTKVVVLLEGLV